MTIEEIKAEIEAAIPGSQATVILNGSPSAQHSLLLDTDHAFEVSLFLRDHTDLRLDFCSNVSGVDWPEYLEAVYHLYSIEKKRGPVIIRMRTEDRADRIHLPSLTPIWRSAEFQEREIFDLYGIFFDGHPDLRRILMWEEFTDHPMRKDYLPPADDEDEAVLAVQP
jgi:NADH-quinone oxidoreductase subunit C